MWQVGCPSPSKMEQCGNALFQPFTQTKKTSNEVNSLQDREK